jgi:hypothetical protein
MPSFLARLAGMLMIALDLALAARVAGPGLGEAAETQHAVDLDLPRRRLGMLPMLETHWR